MHKCDIYSGMLSASAETRPLNRGGGCTFVQ